MSTPGKATPVPASKLAKLKTPDLIDQYEEAIARPRVTTDYNNTRQKRVNRIVDLIADRAYADDSDAQAWMDKK